MCLYQGTYQNKRYTANKKNGGIIPAFLDRRELAVPIGCGRCMICKNKRANEWKFRIIEEIKHQDKRGHFVTLSFSEREYRKLARNLKYRGYKKVNEIAKIAVKRFRERWRKKYKKSPRHFLVTELGGNSSERLHLHGIIWINEPKSEIRRIWKYGNVWMGYNDEDTYVNEQTAGYTVKYITKTDEVHPNYDSIVLTSPGMGKEWLNSHEAKTAAYNGIETVDNIRDENGYRKAIPTYYRRKMYTDEERIELWMSKLDKQTKYLAGIEIDVSKTMEDYYNIRNTEREKNSRLGFQGVKDKEEARRESNRYDMKRQKWSDDWNSKQ